MVEDRKQHPNNWDSKVTSEGELRKLDKVMDAMEARMSRFWITVVFLCGFCSGVAFILLIQ